ncbi:MAG: hypothetical protein QOJ99_369 [Bryobacterales bacterium]|nr:hypothetical protein [Bryobacterales bacterium]
MSAGAGAILPLFFNLNRTDIPENRGAYFSKSLWSHSSDLNGACVGRMQSVGTGKLHAEPGYLAVGSQVNLPVWMFRAAIQGPVTRPLV